MNLYIFNYLSTVYLYLGLLIVTILLLVYELLPTSTLAVPSLRWVKGKCNNFLSVYVSGEGLLDKVVKINRKILFHDLRT